MKKHIRIVVEIADGLKSINSLNRYLELGIYHGRCFNCVAPLVNEEAYAVDINDSLSHIKHNKNLRWFQGKSEDFFKTHNKNKLFDMVFIDADHRHSASMLDFEMVFPLTKDNGLILLHDTYPPDYDSIIGKKSGYYCGDTYKTAEAIRNNFRNMCEIVTLPFYSGVSIVRKTTKQLHWM